jgi:RNA 2',3'-cyclic 3'-phosphodiesterase
VLWAGMAPCNALTRLQQELELALIRAGVPPEGRPFSPHITLARLKDSAPAEVKSFELRNGNLSCVPFQVSEFVLYSSVLTRHGAIHSKEAVYPCSEAPTPPRPGSS